VKAAKSYKLINVSQLGYLLKDKIKILKLLLVYDAVEQLEMHLEYFELNAI
jgi:hypothetical protein